MQFKLSEDTALIVFSELSRDCICTVELQLTHQGRAVGFRNGEVRARA